MHLKWPFIFVLMITFRNYGQQKLKSPEEFLGYKLGNQYTPHHKVIDYFNYVDKTRSDVQVLKYGQTYEGRPLIAAFISSEANINNLEKIRENNLKRCRVLEGEPEVNQPVILWMSYNVHGNETSSTEAALKTFYTLINSENSSAQEWLKNTVVIIDPCLNPDGRERYINWYNQVHNLNPDPLKFTREHSEPWPHGRFNHYLFDLNRDWAWQTQKESQARIKIYNSWMPQVHADFHEMRMSYPYYFAPAAEPFHEMITVWQRSFQKEIGKNHARHFDKNGWLYFTREIYDLFYPSYGDTWPTYNGAIGMTYEMGGIGAGLKVVREEQDTLTLAQRVEHHYTTGLSTLEIVSKNAAGLLREFELFFEKSTASPGSKYKSYLIKANEYADNLPFFLEVLDKNQIRYGRAGVAKKIKGINFHSGKEEMMTIEQNDVVISLYQPKSVLANILLEPSSKLPDSLTYDITAWSLPYAYGLKAYAFTQKLDPQIIKLDSGDVSKIPSNSYAYIIPWRSLNSARVLAELLEKNIKVRYVETPFKVNDETYERGSLVITRAANRNVQNLDSLLFETGKRNFVKVEGVPSGFVNDGPDLGSGSVKTIRKPEIGLIAGEHVNETAFGSIWHFFEQDLKYPIHIINSSSLSSLVLKQLDVLILSSGNYSRIINENLLNEIRTWVGAGGKLILLEDAVGLVANKEGFALEKAHAGSKEEVDQDKEASLETSLTLYKNKERNEISKGTGGAVFKVHLDNSHPLAFGYPDYYYTLKTNSLSFKYLENGGNVGIIKQDGYLSGFVGKELRKKVDNTVVFAVQNYQAGQIVYFVDHPFFRSFWQNGKLMMANALFFSASR